MQQTFTNALGSSPYTEDKVKEAIATLNNKRQERLFLVLDYIEDQGEYFAIKVWNLFSYRSYWLWLASF